MSKITNLFNVKNAGNYPLRIIDNASSVIGYLYPDQTTIIGLADNSTAAGTWSCMNLDLVATVALNNSTAAAYVGLSYRKLDANRSFFLMWDRATSYLYGQVYDASTLTWGTATLIRSAAVSSTVISLSIATDTILVVSDASTAREAVVVGVSGTTITVNTAATAVTVANRNFYSLVAVGSSYILSTNLGSANSYLQAITVSGVTVTIGTEVTSLTSGTNQYVFAATSSTGIAITGLTSSGLRVIGFSVSGTTITIGTVLSVANSNYAGGSLYCAAIGSNWIAVYGGATPAATIITLTGTVPTGSSVTSLFSTASSLVSDIYVTGNKCLVYGNLNGSQISSFNIITNSSGTASKGTSLEKTTSSSTNGRPYLSYISGNLISFVILRSTSTAYLGKYVIDISGSSPTLSSSDVIYGGNGGTSTAYGALSTVNSIYTTGSVAIGLYNQASDYINSPITILNTSTYRISPTRYFNSSASGSTGPSNQTSLKNITSDYNSNSAGNVYPNSNEIWFTSYLNSTTVGPIASALVRVESIS